MIQLTEVSIEGIKEYRRRERECWIPARETWLDGADYWTMYHRGISQSLDHRLVLNWTWDTEALKNRKWGNK